jgi:deoxyribose-phosphate aldolase
MNYVSEELSDRYIRDAVLAAFALIRTQAEIMECDESIPKGMHKMITDAAEMVVEEVISSAIDVLEKSGDDFIKQIKAATAEMMEEEND